MDYSYLIMPFVTWLVTGSLKFLVNSVRARQLAFGLIGYGGFPSNHAAIVVGMAILIALKEGISHPAFGAAAALAFIVILDANSLRRQIGKHAAEINRLSGRENGVSGGENGLRERIGHTVFELVGGAVSGAAVAWAVSRIL